MNAPQQGTYIVEVVSPTGVLKRWVLPVGHDLVTGIGLPDGSPLGLNFFYNAPKP